ncbi:MAG: hypothetical protein RID09_09280 [Coleofasciculus sp. G1-WW12-02]|uniref:hypothetical protein n=1 Tax=Coleofasciculus sp. G1-WW12-02 TaxID=3068483 RepID=UPI0032F38948
MSFREPIRKKNFSPLSKTSTSNPLQRRRFKVPNPPEKVVQRSPEEQKAFLQQQLEKAAFVGYNGLNVPVNVPETPPLQSVQKQSASGALENNSQQSELDIETTESQKEETVEQEEELSSEASSQGQERPNTETDGEGVTSVEQSGNVQHQSQIPDLQAQRERVSRLSSNWLNIPVKAPVENSPQDSEVEATSEQEETVQQEELSPEEVSQNQESPNTEVEGEDISSPGQSKAESGKQQPQIRSLQAQLEKVSKFGYNGLNVPVKAPGTRLSQVQRKLSHNKTHHIDVDGGISLKPSEGVVQAKVDVSQPEQAEPLTSNPQTDASASTEAVESIVAAVVESLQTDPEDSSGQVKRRLKSLEPATRKAVMAKLQNRIPPEQWQRLSVILAEPDSAEEKETPAFPELEEIAPDEGDVSEQEAQDATEGGSVSSSAPKTVGDATEVKESTTEAATLKENRGNEGKETPEEQTTELSSKPGDVDGGSSTTAPQSTPTEEATSSSQTTSDASVEPSTGLVENRKTPNGEVPTTEGNTPVETQKKQPAAPSAQSTAAKTPESGMSTQSSPGAIASGVSESQQGGAGLAIAQNNSLPNTGTQTPSTNFAGTQIFLEQVAAAANAARQRFTERLTQGTDAIAASVRQQQEALISASDQQGSAIGALFANAREQVGQIISSAQAQLQTDATSHLATLQQGHTATLCEVETTFSSSQEQAQELGDSYAEQSLEAADNSAEQVQSRLQGMAQEARSIGQEKAQVGGSTPEIAQAKAQAANEIASDTADKITSGMSDAMGELRATGPETANSFREQGQEAASQLSEGQGQVVEQLNTSNQETIAAIQQAVGQGNQALGNLQGQLIEQLVSLEQTIQNQLQSQVAQKSQELYAAGEQAINTFQEQGQQAIASGDEHLTQFNQQVTEIDIDPELASEATTEIVGQVDGAYNNLMSTADGALQQADSALVEAGNQVLTAIGSVSSHAAGQIQTFLGQAQGQVSQQITSISDQLGTTVSQASDAESSMVSEVASSLDEQISQLDTGFGAGLEQYTGGLDEQVTSVKEQASEPRQSLPGRTEEAQQRAEERAQNSWIENQWNDLVEMVSSPGFWAGLVVGLLVGALIIATFGTGAVVLVAAGAIAGAVGALAATVVGNYSEGKRGWAVFDGALRNMIWGAFGGAVGAAAFVFLGGVAAGMGLSAGATLGLFVGGASVVAGVVTVLDNVSQGRPWDQGLLANMLFAGLLTWIGGKIAGRRSGDAPESTPRQPGDAPESTPRQPGDAPESTPRQPGDDTPESTRASRQGDSAEQQDTPDQQQDAPSKTTELPPEEVSRLVSERNDGTFRLNRKKISNVSKIVGEPEATVAEHAAREAYAAERAAGMNNVEKVYMGQAADEFINPNARPGTELSADVVGVTRQGKYVIFESKGTEILHGLEQLEYSGNTLGREQVVRYEIVVAEEIRTPGFTIRNRLLYLNGEPYLINGKPVHVRTTTSTAE